MRIKGTGFHLIIALLALIPLGCVNVDKKPKLSESEREIVERRKGYGQRTNFERQRGNGSWRYESDDDQWNYRRDPDSKSSVDILLD